MLTVMLFGNWIALADVVVTMRKSYVKLAAYSTLKLNITSQPVQYSVHIYLILFEGNTMKIVGCSRTQFELLVLILLISINLRPFMVAPGAILANIIKDIELSYNQASILTLLPMLLMGFGAFGVAAFQSIITVRKGLLIALGSLTIGSFLRLSVFNNTTLVLTTALCGVGVAYIQSVLPGMIKAHFPKSIPTVTGIYSAAMMVGGALGAHFMPVLLELGYNWQASLAWIALPGFIAFVVAVFVVPEMKVALPNRAIVVHLLRRPRTWSLMAAFGIVNGGYASMVTWLAPFYQKIGWSIGSSSQLIVVMAICQASFAAALPLLIRRTTDRRPWLLATVIMQGIGFAGLVYMPNLYPMLWVGICGAGLGGAFALNMVTALDHIPNPETAGSLAALMQGGGFLIAAIAPLLFAQLHHWTGEFYYGWSMHILLLLLTAIIYTKFNPKYYTQAMRFPLIL